MSGEITDTADAVTDTIFGGWVYCSQHRAAHRTGWCTIGNRDKLGLGDVETQREAEEKCRSFGLPLHCDYLKALPKKAQAPK